MRQNRSNRNLRRHKPSRPPFDRVLIVCEGRKTEPNYLNEIRTLLRIAPVHFKIMQSLYGTQPLQIVECAIDEFNKTKSFERVYAVFDRDDHDTYANAIHKAEAFSNKLKNNERKPVQFIAIASVPCFELWLLLHFADIKAWLHRNEALERLRQFIPGYEKGSNDVYSRTANLIETATGRAKWLKGNFSRLPGNDAYTDVHELVAHLQSLTRN